MLRNIQSQQEATEGVIAEYERQKQSVEDRTNFSKTKYNEEEEEFQKTTDANKTKEDDFVKSIFTASTHDIILFFTKTTIPVFIGSLFMMCGYLCGMAVFGAKIRDLTPDGKAGMLQGVRICAQVLVPGVIGPKIGSWVLRNAELVPNNDGTFSFLPNQNIFLAALVAAVCLLPLLWVLRRRVKKDEETV